MKVEISSAPAQSRQVKQRLANPEESLSYELGKAVQELPPLYTRLLAGGISLLVFGTLTWAHLSKVDEVAVAQGKLVPSTEVRPIRASEVGSIRTVNVKEGDVVQKDQVLAEIFPGTVETNVESLEKEAQEIEQAIARLEAESQGKLTGTPEQNLLTAARLEDLRRKQESAIAEANSKRDAISEGEIRLVRLQENLSNAQINLQNARTVADNSKEILAKAEERRNRLEVLNQQGGSEGAIVPHQEYLRAQEEVLRAQDNVTNSQDRVTEANDKIVSIEKEMAAQRERIAQARQTFAAAESSAAGLMPERQSQVFTQLAQRREELAKKRGEIQVAKQRQLEKETLKAPFEGKIYNVKVTRGPVQQGEELLSILPKDQELVLEVDVLNRDIGFIRPGQRVKVKLATFPFQEFGIVDGEVVRVSPDAVVRKDETGRDLGPVFPTKVRLSKHAINVRGKAVELTPGMVATGEIVTRQKTILQYLIEPITRRFDEAFSGR